MHLNAYDHSNFSFTGNETGLDFNDFLSKVDSSYIQSRGGTFTPALITSGYTGKAVGGCIRHCALC